MTPQFNPIRLQIFEADARPATPPASFKLDASQLWNAAGVQSGFTDPKEAPSRGDVRLFRLDNWQGAPEELVARENAGKIPALTPGWKTSVVDDGVENWQQMRMPGELALIAKARESAQSDLDALYAKAEDDKGQPKEISDADKSRIVDLESELQGLDTRGFLETIPGAQLWGNRATGVYRRLSTANVPFHVSHRLALEGRPFTLWLYRAKPRPSQAAHTLTLEIGPLLRLVLEGEDRAILYRKNESRNPQDWAGADAKRAALLEKQTLTPAQTEAIDREQEEIAGIKAELKDAKKKLSSKSAKDALDKVADEKIFRHKTKIKALQKSVGLTDAEKAALKELEKFLFRQIETVELAETAQSLIGRPFALTFLDSGVGYAQIALDIGRNVWVFEDKYLTSQQIEAPLWSVGNLQIKGSGGALAWRFGFVNVNTRDEITTAPQWIGEGVETQGVPVVGRWLMPRGCGITFSLDPAGPSGFARAKVVFTTDGKRLPFLFRGVIQVPATPRLTAAPLWDSASATGAVLRGSPHFDEERKSAIWQLNLSGLAGLGALSLPSHLKGKGVHIWVGGRRVLTSGVLVDDTLLGAKDVGDGTAHAWGEVRLTIRDKAQSIADSPILEEIELDGMWLGDAIYHLRRNQGASEDELSLLPRGRASGWKLPQAPVGDKSALAPGREGGSPKRLDYIQNELVKRFGLGRAYYIDADGRDRLELPSNRARRDGNDEPIVYRPSQMVAGVAGFDPRRIYYGESGIERTRSFDGYFTVYEVFGSVDPDTRLKRAWRYELAKAVDPVNKDEDYYTGEHRIMEPVSDEAYTQNHQLEAVGRTQIALHGKPREVWATTVPYEADVLPGEVFLLARENGQTTPFRVRSAKASDDLTRDEIAVEWETL